MNRLFLFILLLFISSNLKSQDNDKCLFGVYELQCEQRINPIGIDNKQPRFSWKISSVNRGFVQTAYQILVSDSKNLLDSDTGNMWNSGICKSSQSVLVNYNGRELESSKKYFWKVKVWDKNSNSCWSKTGYFITGVFNDADWGNAKWISLESDDKSKSLFPGIHAPLVESKIGKRMIGNYKLPIARRVLNLNKEIENAFISMSGLGHFDLYINGQPVSDHFMDAGWTNYSKTALYATFDVTDMLDANTVLSVALGNGFYNIPRERYYKQLVSFGAPKFKMNMKIHYKDGTTETVVSDELWRIKEGPITYSSIYGGEDYDARKETDGWMLPHFDDSKWNKPVISSLSVDLISQKSEPLTVRDTLKVVKKFKNKKGNWIYDFGQNFSGTVKIKVGGNEGETIRITPGELLDADSTVNQKASGGPYYWSYTLSDKTQQEWSPRFSYYGFRYVEISGCNDMNTFEINGLHTTNSATESGYFNCSLPIFNKTYDLIDWSMRSNLSSILTDCPHREKLGWLEVAHLMQYSLQYRYHLPGFYNQMMKNMADSQTANGMIPSIAPEYVRFSDGFEDSPEWGSAFIIIPWYVYKWYGDDSLLRYYYKQMKNYINYLSSRAKDNTIEYGLGDWFDLGPNNPGVSQLTSKGVTATAIYYYDLKIMNAIAEYLNNDNDALYFRKLMKNVKYAYNERYYNTEGYYDRNSQTANSISLYFGLVEEENYNKVYQNLINDIKQRNYALTSGDIGYRYLIKVLEKNGDSEIIYKMNNRYDVPGYGWQIAYGATALTESWQAYGFVSNNHCMLGHLMEWFFGSLGGICQQDNSTGFKNILIKPQILNEMRFSESSYSSPYGDIRCNWKKSANNITIDIEVPSNSEAMIVLPHRSMVLEGGIPVDEAEGCKIIKSDGKNLVIKAGSGNYKFTLSDN